MTISQLAEETGFARETVGKRLGQFGVSPVGKRDLADVYLLRDCLQALYGLEDGSPDPQRMKPFERKAFYQAETERLALEARAGTLMPRQEFEDEIARVLKILTQALEVLPDKAEGDLALPPEVVILIERECDITREAIHAALSAKDDDGPAIRNRA